MALKYQILVDDKGNAVFIKSTKNIKKMGKAASKTGSVFKGVFASAAVIGAIRKLGQAISLATMSFVSYEKEMSKVKAISGATSSEFAALEKKAKELGRTTMFSASQSAAAFTELSKMGFKANETIEASEGVLSLAAVAQIEMAEAATTAAGTLRGFGLDVSQMTGVVDIMAASFTSSALDNEKWTESMKMVSPIARLANVSLTETAAALSVLADRQIAGSLAGTGMRRVLIELSSSTSKAGKALGGASLKTHSLGELLNKLREKGFGVTEMQELFGKRAFAVAAVLADQSKVIGELNEKYQNSEGAAKEMSDIMLKNVWGSAKLAASALEGLAIAIIQPFSPVIMKVIDGFTFVVSELAGHFETVGEKIGIVARSISMIFTGSNLDNARQFELVITSITTVFRLFAKSAIIVSAAVKTLWIGFKNIIDLVQAFIAGAIGMGQALRGIFSAKAAVSAQMWGKIASDNLKEVGNNINDIKGVWETVGIALALLDKPLQKVLKTTKEIKKSTVIATPDTQGGGTLDGDKDKGAAARLALQRELRLELIKDAQDKELEQLANWMEDKSIIAGANEAMLTDLVTVEEQKRIAIKKKFADEEKKLNRERAIQSLQTVGMMLGGISSLGEALGASKETLKGIRSAEVVANTAAGIMSAFGQGLPFPLAVGQSIAIGLLGMAQLARINSEKMAEGGRVLGSGNSTSDNVRAWLSPDEHVLSVKDVARLGGHNRIQQSIDNGVGGSRGDVHIHGNVIGQEDYVRDHLMPQIQEEMMR